MRKLSNLEEENLKKEINEVVSNLIKPELDRLNLINVCDHKFIKKDETNYTCMKCEYFVSNKQLEKKIFIYDAVCKGISDDIINNIIKFY